MGIIMKTLVGAPVAVLLLALAVPAMAQYGGPGWPSEATSFQYHPFRFHFDGGGTITQRTSATELDNGWNVGAGLTWYPSSQLPLGLRLDGSYNHFSARTPLLSQAAAFYQTPVDNGTVRMWGGDVDLEIDFRLGARVRGYLVAGGGWYKQQITYRQEQLVGGYLCDWWGDCYPGYIGVDSIVARKTTQWHFARNVGFGLEFALGGRASFFVDARYMRLDPNDRKSDFLPIRAGLRF
jgi:opacity protein-like surface antigen